MSRSRLDVQRRLNFSEIASSAPRARALPAIDLFFFTLEKESSLGSLWDQEQCAQFCSKDELWEAVKEEEMKIPWKEAQEGVPVLEETGERRDQHMFSFGEIYFG